MRMHSNVGTKFLPSGHATRSRQSLGGCSENHHEGPEVPSLHRPKGVIMSLATGTEKLYEMRKEEVA
jgi:hypothetical protein